MSSIINISEVEKMSNKIAIVTDSTCDLSKEIIDRLDIKVLNLHINFSNETFEDIKEINAEKLYTLVESKKEMPKTSAVSIGEFMEAFESLCNDGYDIFFMGIGSSFSSTYSNAVIAAREFPECKIVIYDSMNLSSGTGLQLMKVAKFRDQGLSVDEIALKMKAITPLVRSQFAIETMEYLHKGGRCKGITRWFGTILKLKPIIEVRSGEMNVGKLPHGKMKVALDKLIDYITLDKEKVDEDNIFITHSLATDGAKYLNDKLKEMFPKTMINITDAGSVISSHCGAGTIGVLYILREN